MSWIQSPRLLIQWAGPIQFTFPLSPEQLMAYLAGSEGVSPIRRVFAAVDDGDEVIGHIEIGAIDRANQTGSLCRVLVAPAFQGRGMSQPMVRAALEIGFDEMCLRRIDLKVYSFNTSAIRCYQRAGFVQEGVLKQAVKFGDEYWDTVLMAILRNEWLAASSGRGHGNDCR